MDELKEYMKDEPPIKDKETLKREADELEKLEKKKRKTERKEKKRLKKLKEKEEHEDKMQLESILNDDGVVQKEDT